MNINTPILIAFCILKFCTELERMTGLEKLLSNHSLHEGTGYIFNAVNMKIE